MSPLVRRTEYRLEARLTDLSRGGNYGPAPADGSDAPSSRVIHDIAITARLRGPGLEMNERAPFAPQAQASGEWMSAGLQVAPRLADACYSLRRGGPVLAAASTGEQVPAEEAD